MMKKILFLALLCFSLRGFHLTRAIVASDYNELYYPFWPLVAKSWSKLIGIRPTLIFVGPRIPFDETIGDVIYFDPIPGVPTSDQALIVRMLVPALFPDDFCIVSDMDMIAINRSYFQDSVTHIPANKFVVYRDGAYPPHDQAYPMCYIAAKGTTYAEVFKINKPEDIVERIVDWYNLGLGWCTCEIVLRRYLNAFDRSRVVKLGHGVNLRIDRPRMQYDPARAKRKEYIDAHLSRPYAQHKEAVDRLASILGIM